MPLPFSATLRALDCDGCGRGGWRALALLPAAALLGMWIAWSLLAEIPVTVESVTATLQGSRPYAITAPGDGVVTASALRLGLRVRAGETLLALDDRELRGRLAGLRARRAALTAAAAALAGQQAASRRALAEEALAQVAAGDESAGQARQAAAAAALAEQVRVRDGRLAADGLLAAAEAIRSGAEAERQRLAAAGAVAAMAAARSRGRAAHADREGAARRLDGELERLRGDIAGLAAEAGELERDVARRRVTAPVDGRLGEIAAPQPGGFVARGAVLATLVAEAPLHVAAVVPAVAGAAVRIGQRGWVRVAGGGGPGRPPALLAAIVSAVAPAAATGRDGWEVELAPAGEGWTGSWTERSGLACLVTIELERRTPAELALRALGRTNGTETGAAGKGTAGDPRRRPAGRRESPR
jgi:multidrug resistance efflux pump